jgi:hypothetical protein
MRQRHAAINAIAISAVVVWAIAARAEMGPCAPDGQGWLICGSGDGAAQVIVKTISPSGRLAFAWRLVNRPPTDRPGENDPNLENLIVRLQDGAVLAKSRGSYWDLGTKIAKAYAFAAWSPDSRLMIKVEQSARSASAELFSFTGDDVALGPFEMVKIIQLATLAQMQGVKDASNYQLLFASKPAITIDDQGLLHAWVFNRDQDSMDGPVYDATLQVTRTAGSLDAKVVSVEPYLGTSVSVIVH